MNDPKILICGVGSIGEQHINNLLNLGYENIILYRTRNAPLRTINRKFKTFNSLKKALGEKPTLALICNSTHLHLKTAISCAKARCHLFIEKPVSSNLDGISALEKICNNNNLICMVGYMMRYHPSINKIKEWLDKGYVGKLIYYRSEWGEYIPDWHPWEDYKISYAANNSMGGGPALTLSHDIDLALYICQKKVNNVIKINNYGSELDLKCEHGVEFILSFTDKTTASIHLNYFEKPPRRLIQITGSKANITFDYYKNKLDLVNSDNKNNMSYSSKKFNRNELFIDEINDFFAAIKNKQNSPISLKEGKKSLEIINWEKN